MLMANNVRKFAEDIIKIVGLKDKRSGLDDAKFREPIAGARATAYAKLGGGIGTSRSGKNSGSYGGNASNGASNYRGTSEAGRYSRNGAQSYGGSGSGGSGTGFDPFEQVLNELQAKTDVEDIIDGTGGPGLGASERLTEIDGMEDPNSGNEYTLRFGTDSHSTPDGWDQWDDPPSSADPTFTAGYYYTSVFAACGSTQSATEQAECMVATYISSPTFSDAVFLDFNPPIPPGDTSTGFFVTAARIELTLEGSGSTIIVSQGIHRFACTGGDPSGPGQYCSTEPPLTGPPEGEWPSDGKISFLSYDINFQPSEYENGGDLVGFTQTRNNTLQFNFGELGGRSGEIATAADGSKMVYETVNDSPVGNFKKFDQAGKLIDVGPVSEIPAHLPVRF